jgi:competence protein ComFC
MSRIFPRLPAEVCEFCGTPVATPFAPGAGQRLEAEASGATQRGCFACRGRPYAFARVRSYAAYEGKLIRAVVMLKFERREPLAAWFATQLAAVAERESLAADVVLSVPLHRQRQRERGYNQADLIARPLAQQPGLPYQSVLLMRTKPRPDKHILSLSERWESVRGAFATRSGSQIDILRVLLVDDVMTTGAPLDAGAKALRQAGAKSVIGLTVARALKHPVKGSSDDFQ